MNSFDGRESRIDQELDAALVTESRQHASEGCGIAAREQQSAGFDEVTLELHFLLEGYRCQGTIFLGDAAANPQIRRPPWRAERILDAHHLEQRRPVGNGDFEYRQGRGHRDMVTDEIANHALYG